MNIGERIKLLRQANGMTQEDLARKLNYKDRSTIAYIERDGGRLTMPKVQEFAKVLGVTPEHLMGWDDIAAEIEPSGDNFIVETDKNELIRLYDSLNEEGKEVALNVLRGLATQYKSECDKSEMVNEA